MRVYTRAEFMKLPTGTLYCKGKPWYFDALHAKGDTLETDFVGIDLCIIEHLGSDDIFGKLEDMRENGSSYPINKTGYSRDGCFDGEDLFLVFEPEDLRVLRSFIDTALAASPRQPNEVASLLASDEETLGNERT